MSDFIFTGKTYVLGNHIDTDAILPARFLDVTTERELGTHFMEDLCPGLVGQIQAGSILIAGENFGCGSSREHAPLAIRGAGIACVVAKSFSRIFYRNSINIGLPVLISQHAGEIGEDKLISVDCVNGLIKDEMGGTYTCQPLPPFMLDILADGGLLRNLDKRMNGTIND